MKNKKIKVIKRNIDPQTFRNMTMQYDKNDNFKSLNLFFLNSQRTFNNEKLLKYSEDIFQQYFFIIQQFMY